MKSEEKAYLYWLHHVPGVGDGAMYKLIDVCKSAKGVYYASDKQLLTVLKPQLVNDMRSFTKEWSVAEAYGQMEEKGIRMICRQDKDYPKRLKKIENPPYILYLVGNLPQEEKPAVAIVGARECSQYGTVIARAFATGLAQAGVSIISGMARGIDGISQAAALETGATFAVLGCGVDVCYPASNRKLYEAIKEKGGVLSPYPPGTQPQRTLFPYRNKIVAGLSDAVLVVEARQKSGTWITVDMALEQGKDVYAVPGRLTDRLSDGCNLLIRQGAGIALSPEDMLAELKVLKNRQEKKTEKAQGFGRESLQKNSENKTGLIKYLDLYPKLVDEILESVQKEEREMTLPQLMFELIQLCIQGKAVQVGGNYFMKVAEKCKSYYN